MKKRGRPLSPLTVTDQERAELEGFLRRRRVARADAQRAKVILLAAEGCSNEQIAQRVGLSLPTVGKWRQRFVVGRLESLSDALRSGH